MLTGIFSDLINRLKLIEKNLAPPEVPTCKDYLDTSNFDEEFTQQDPKLTPTDSNPLSCAFESHFIDFDYIADWAMNDRIQAMITSDLK